MNALYPSRPFVIAAIIAVSLFGAGCDKYTDSGQTVGQKVDNAIDKTNAKIVSAGAKVEKKVEQAGVVASNVGESIATTTGAAISQTGTAVAVRANQVGAIVTDSAITASIKADLVKDPGLSALGIDVNTVRGEVTLKGKVSTEVRRDRAESIAKNIVGVTKVTNLLVVSPG